MIHTYSLIHDDLPCMDDDGLRRNKPSCHVAFGEDTALLAGDALQSLAFETALRTNISVISKENLLEALFILARAIGAEGMAGGQVMDMTATEADLPYLLDMYGRKTGALLQAAILMGCTAAGSGADVKAAASHYGKQIGLAFQVVDDILDVLADERQSGKPQGSDARSGKRTAVTVLGLNKARAFVTELTQSAVETIGAFENTGPFCELADWLAQRTN